MKFFAFLVGTILISHASAAAWFGFQDTNNPANTIQAQPVAEATQRRCLQLADQGHCNFYDCLEDKFQCGENGYTRKVSKHFCSKIDADFNSFDTFGKRWLNRTSICLLTYMLPIYNSDSTSCQAIKNAGIEAILNCNGGEVDGRDFCDFLDTNGDAYNNLMGIEEVQLMLNLRDTRVFRSMITEAVTCGVGNLAETARSASEYISSLFNRFTNYFWN